MLPMYVARPSPSFRARSRRTKSYVSHPLRNGECRGAYELINRDGIYLPNRRNVIPTMIVRE